MAIDHEMIPHDDIETRASRYQVNELVDFLYKRGICASVPKTRNLGLMGGWAVHFSLNDFWLESQGHQYLGSRDIDVFIECEGSRYKEFLQAIKELGYWERNGKEYVKVLHKDPNGMNHVNPTIIPEKEYSNLTFTDSIFHRQ